MTECKARDLKTSSSTPRCSLTPGSLKASLRNPLQGCCHRNDFVPVEKEEVIIREDVKNWSIKAGRTSKVDLHGKDLQLKRACETRCRLGQKSPNQKIRVELLEGGEPPDSSWGTHVCQLSLARCCCFQNRRLDWT